MTIKPESGVKKVMWNFGQYTSIHALPRIIQTKSTCAKVIWSLIFILMCILFAYTISALVINYLAFPTVQTTRVIQGQPLFPSVTFCNANPMRRSKLTGTLASKYGDTSSRKKRSIQGYSVFNAKMEFLTLTSGLSESHRQSMEHQKSDFIIQCTYDGKPCGKDNLVYHHDTLYGACFTYNKASEKGVNKLGPFSGLDLILNIEEGEYLNDITAISGAVVTFHASFTPPPVQERPLFISPGYQTSVTVSQIEVCKRKCIASAVEDKCGCKSPLYESGGEVCGLEKMDCLSEAMESDLKNCDCPSPCQETVYKFMTSSTTWPTKSFEPTLEQSVAGVSDSLDSSIANGTMRDNLLNLKVSFQWLQIEETTQAPTMTIAELLTSVGVTSVIFIGCSFISYIEFLELIFLLITTALCKRGNSGSKAEHV